MSQARYGPGLEESLTLPSRESISDEEDDIDESIHLASVTEKKRLWIRNAAINTLFISAWFVFATILSVYNKWMFAPERFGFPYPLFVTTLHMFVQFALAALLRAIWPHRFRPPSSPTKADFGRKVIPTAMATGLDIGLSNLSLKTITLSFYTMCKSSSLIFVLLFAFLFKLEAYSHRLVGVISLIFGGVLLMVATETHFVLSGFVLVLSASALGGLRWSLTQLLLKNKKMGLDNPAATIYWLAPVMGLTLATISAILDNWGALYGSRFFQDIPTTINTSFFLLAPGVVAFCMVLSEFYILQRAGVVPMSIAGIAKEVTTITVSAWFFGDELTPLNIVGVAVTVCGIALFTYHKYRKSIEATIPLDVHGDPVEGRPTFDSIRAHAYHELAETSHLTAERSRGTQDFDLDDTSLADASRLFLPGEGEEDAEDIRSVHSGNVRSHALGGGVQAVGGSGHVEAILGLDGVRAGLQRAPPSS